MWKPFGSKKPKLERGLHWDFTPEELRFSMPGAGTLEWLTLPPEGLNQLDGQRIRVLGQWLMDGVAECEDAALIVSLERFYLAEEDDRRALLLAPDSKAVYRLQSTGSLHEPQMCLTLEIRKLDGSALFGFRREGAFLTDGLARYQLSAGEFRFFQAVEAFNLRPDSDRTHERQLALFARVKQAAEPLGVVLDQYLSRETAILPETLGIDLVALGPDEIEIRPVVAEVDPTAVAHALDTYRSAPEIMTLQGVDGGRSRLVLDSDQREGLDQIKRVRRLRGKARRDFLARPQDFLDAERIDLDSFSTRIIGIGQYQVRYYPLITNRERSWIPDQIALVIASDDPAVEPTTIPFEGLGDLEPLEAAYQSAKAQDEPAMQWGGQALPLDGDTERTLSAIREALEVRERHAASVPSGETADLASVQPEMGDRLPDDDLRNVLLIEENLEEVEYQEDVGEGAATPSLSVARPKALKEHVRLLPHQVDGLAWLQSRFRDRARGVLLADDMGLGKTLQILGFLAWYVEHHSDAKPILVIAPVALLENWKDEYEKFLVPIFGAVLSLHGATLARLKQVSGGGREYQYEGGRKLLDTEAIARHSLVLTTYEAVRDYQFSLASLDWGVVVTDEAQKIKTPGALMTNAAKALKADFRIVSTGTPVENSLVDLWCLADFAQPGLLGALRTFRTEFESPVGEETPADRSQRLRDRIDKAFLRRLKRDILSDLPPREEHRIQIPMADGQARTYLEATEAFRAKGLERASILGMLERMRMISVHPELGSEDEPRLVLSQLTTTAPKLAWVVETLGAIARNQEKCILFARERRVQRLLAQLVQAAFGFNPVIVNGETPGASTSGASRKSLIDAFQQKRGFNVIILSPLAVGFGLTITEANHAVHVTRLWNPAKEDQATDRVYRIGQTRDVHVYYPTVVDPFGRFMAFDEILATLLDQKRQLAGDVLYPSENLGINPEELMRLLMSQSGRAN